MKVGLLENVGLVFIESLILYGLLRKLVTGISGRKRNLKQAAVIGIISVMLLSAHLYIFQTILKQDNYYEVMQIERAYSTEKLTRKARQIMSANHPDKIESGDSTYFNKLTLIRDTLADPIYHTLYDAFGEFTIPENHTQAEFKRQALQMEAQINIYGFFSVYFIVSTVSSYGKRFKIYRILSNIILVALFAQEVYLCSEAGKGAELLTKGDPQKRATKNNRFEVPNDGLFDNIFPNMATFERLLLLRLIALAVITGMRLYFDLQIKEEVDSGEDELEEQINKLEKVLNEQQGGREIDISSINKSEQENSNEEGLIKMLNEQQLKDNQELVRNINNLAKHNRDSKSKEGKFTALIKKAFKITIGLGFAYYILESYVQQKS